VSRGRPCFFPSLLIVSSAKPISVATWPSQEAMRRQALADTAASRPTLQPGTLVADLGAMHGLEIALVV
jgi:hypothetical protein